MVFPYGWENIQGAYKTRSVGEDSAVPWASEEKFGSRKSLSVHTTSFNGMIVRRLICNAQGLRSCSFGECISE